jgi:RNA polymerase sigma factor (sigma-70 family)
VVEVGAMPSDYDAERRLVHQALVTGDRAAFEELFVRYWPECYAYATALLGRLRADAEDSVQEAFVRVWVNRLQYDAQRPFSPWIHTFVHHLCVDVRRRAARLQVVDVGSDLDSLPGGSDFDPDRFRLVHDVAEILSPEDFALFRRRFIDEAPVAVIAQEYGLTPQAINYRLRRIRKSLIEAEVLTPPPSEGGEGEDQQPDDGEEDETSRAKEEEKK